ncbi:MAG: SpoIIIAH-like family protein [Bacilli bacterium]
MNRQLVAFLSLFSIVLLLSVYYVLVPFASSSQSGTQPVAQEIVDPTTAYFDTLKADRDQEYYYLISELQGEISCSTYTNSEKETALNSIYNIEKTMKNEQILEEIIVQRGYSHCFVQIQEININVLVHKENPTKYDVVDIIYTVQETLGEEPMIFVEFNS